MPTTTHTDLPLDVETVDSAQDTKATETLTDSAAENVVKTKSNKKHELRVATKQLLAKLYEVYPAIFPKPGTGKPVVLAIGLHKELQTVIKEWGFGNAALRSALAWYTRQLRYQRAVIEATHRTTLDGQQAEEISAEQKVLAQQKIDETNAWLSEHHPEKLQKKSHKSVAASRAKAASGDGDSVVDGQEKNTTEKKEGETKQPVRHKASAQPAFKRKAKPSRNIATPSRSKAPKAQERSKEAPKDMDGKLLDLLNKFNN